MRLPIPWRGYWARKDAEERATAAIRVKPRPVPGLETRTALFLTSQETHPKLTPERLTQKTPATQTVAGARFNPVGAPGFEPGTSCSQSRRDTGLRYAPRCAQVTISCLERATRLAAHEKRGPDGCCGRCFVRSIPRRSHPDPARRNRGRNRNPRCP